MAQRPRNGHFARRAAVPLADGAQQFGQLQIAGEPRLLEMRRAAAPIVAGMAATRSRVMAPDSRPDFIGEYTITPMPCCWVYGRTVSSIRSEEHTSELQS